MRWFTRTKDRQSEHREQELEEARIQDLLRYIRELELPEPSEALELSVFCRSAVRGGERRRFAVRAPYYLLAYADTEEGGSLNAGYVLERAAVLLRFQGVATRILTQVPDRLELPDGKLCVAVLAIGTERRTGSLWGERDSAEPEHPLICRDAGESWTDEVLAYAEKLLPQESQAGVRMIRSPYALHFAAGKYFGRSAGSSRFGAGVLLAAVMAAAEELWMELGMIRVLPQFQEQLAGPDYLITVCRMQDRAKIQKGAGLAVSGTQRRTSVGDHRWKYA